jgi:hypothetical protein
MMGAFLQEHLVYRWNELIKESFTREFYLKKLPLFKVVLYSADLIALGVLDFSPEI